MRNSTVNGVVAALALGAAFATVPVVFGATEQSTQGSESQNIASGMGGWDMSTMPMASHMWRMQEEMARIHATSNPTERNELLKKHMQSMQEMMQMMHGMMAGQGMMGHHAGMMMGMGQSGMLGPSMGQSGMMGGGTGQGEPMGPPPQSGMMSPGSMSGQSSDMMNRLDMMEQRLNVMQLMMDQMLKNQSEMLKAE